MNEPITSSAQLPEGPAPAPAAARTLPRLRFPFIVVLVYWLLWLAMAAVTKPYFVGFMVTFFSTALLTLLFLGWWWFNRGLRLWEKTVGFALIIFEAWLISRFTHRSINLFTMWLIGFPIFVTIIVAWIFFLKKTALAWPRTGFVLVMTAVWCGFLLARTEGADASLNTATHWRWTPTSEQRFLAQSKSGSIGATRSSAKNSSSANHPTNDWIAFRGPQREGVITGTAIATNWTVDKPSLIWKRPVGPAWSSLIIVRGRIYTQEQRGEKETVVCYDEPTGTEIWVHQDAARFDESLSGPGPRATPTFANGRLYTLGGTGLLNCLDLDTGRLLWTRDIKEASAAKAPMWAFSSSPLVTDNEVIVYAGGEAGKGLLAYNTDSGELAWTAPAGQNSYSSPQLTSIANVPQCLMLHDSGLTAVDIATGKTLWQTGAPTKTAIRSGQPHQIDGSKLLVGNLNNSGSSLIEVATNASGQWTTALKWDSKDLKPEFPDFVIHNGHAYGFDIGIFCCLNLADGKRTWKEGRYGRGQVMLLRDQQLLLVSSETGELVLLAADPKQHCELARFQALEGKTWNHPVLIRDRVYLRNAQEMACYALSTASPAGMASR